MTPRLSSPEKELDAFLMTTTEAVDLARSGESDDGHRSLQGALARVVEAAEDGESGVQAGERYRDALDRYELRYGVGRLQN